MSKCNCVYEEFCSMINGNDIVLPQPCAYRKDNTDFVKVVHGEWQYTDAYPHWVCCSICHKRLIANKELIEYYGIPTQYCPNCGAKMDGKGD